MRVSDSPRRPQPATARACIRIGSLALASIGIAGCVSGRPDVAVRDAVIPVPMTADSASVYLTIENSGGADDVLKGVSASSGQLAHLHETAIESDGRASMRAVGTVRIKAGETVRMEPGGLHVMLMNPGELADGDQLQLYLAFEKSGVKHVKATVTDDYDDVLGG